MRFTKLVHADWSKDQPKRWFATATLTDRWTLHDVEPAKEGFLDWLFEQAQDAAVLSGFDFPLGVPNAYGHQTGLASFSDLLASIGTGVWTEFVQVAAEPSHITIRRPFYPAGTGRGARRADLAQNLGVANFDLLRRGCEFRTPKRRAACPLFWTLGGNQVGRAALTGWLEIVRPAKDRGARMWPFDGPLEVLGTHHGLTIAETYPAEAYGHIGVTFSYRESKTRQSDRQSKSTKILEWARCSHVRLSDALDERVRCGFGPGKDGEDKFDAFMGVAGMLEVATGRLNSEFPLAALPWEGWILGQSCQTTPERDPV